MTGLNDNAKNLFKGENSKPEIDYSIILKTCLLDPNSSYPEPEVVLAINQQDQFSIPIFTKESISGLIGKAKGGKTSFVALITAAVIKQYLGDDNISFSSEAKGTVLFFDTEQGKYYANLTYRKILKIAGEQKRLKYYDLRAQSPETRLELIKAALKAEEEIALVIIDGGRDIIYDINSPEEAITIISELMALSVNHKTHICIILHQNKGDNNARGHFGTELVNKSETIISINKSGQDRDISIIEADFTRGKQFEPLAIGLDEEGTPYIIGVQKSQKGEYSGKKGFYPRDITEDVHKSIVEAAFTDDMGFSYTKAYKAIKDSFGQQGIYFGDSKARDFMTYYLQNGLIVKLEPSKGNAKYLSAFKK